LIFYNLSYLPILAKTGRLQQEIKMWTQRVEELSDSLKALATGNGIIFRANFRFDEIFIIPESLTVSTQSEAALREIVPQLRGGTIEVIGHTDNSRPPSAWQSNWDYSAAAAAAVAQRLVTLGVLAARVLVLGAGDTRPLAGKAGADSQILNRRVEIVVRVR